MRNDEGFAFIIVPILLIAAIALVIIVPRMVKNNSIKPVGTDLTLALPTVLPSLTPKQTFISTPLPTPTPTPTSTVLSTPAPSPKPVTPQPVSGPPGAGYSHITVATEKGNFGASVLSIDLNSSRMITDTGNDSECTSNCSVNSLQAYVNKNGGYAGINGTYFCPAEQAYSSCGSNNSYDFPVWNVRLGHWINGGNLGWSSRSIFYTDGSGAHYNQNANGFGGSLTAGIVNNPGLVDNGSVQIDDNQSGLSDKQKSVGLKAGIGLIDQKHILIVIASSVNMQQFAYVFKALGAKGAMNLDEGGSTALYYNGKYIFGPGRNIPNAIIFAK